MSFTISRSIEVDAGHRVPTHGSKCANLHGHRYKVIAEVHANNLQQESEEGSITINHQQDMVLDFGFLKDILIEHVDNLCDHGMILYIDDPWIWSFLEPKHKEVDDSILHRFKTSPHPTDYLFQEGNRGSPNKLLIVPFIPTAERLAEFWYNLMKGDVQERSNHTATLHRVVVWETPNCSACYPL